MTMSLPRRRLLRGTAALAGGLGLRVFAAVPVVAEAGPLQRRLRFTLTFVNPSAQPVDDVRFWCYLPANLDERQALAALEVSMPHERITDRHGHNVLALKWDRMPAFAQKVVSLGTTTELRPAAGPAPLADAPAWLAPERFIESDDPAVTALAATLRRATPMETLRAIYDAARRNVRDIGYVAEDLGARAALERHTGDCTEYADLVVALARANGIPARMLGGHVVEADGSPRAIDYHNWAECHVDGAWRLVDAQKGNWLAPAQRYVAFRIYRDVASNPIGLAHRYRLDGALRLSM